MLKSLFALFDAHPAIYWSVALTITSALAYCVFGRAWRDAAAAESAGTKKRSKIVFVALLVATLFAWRWPYLFATHELSPDESQQVAGAITLVRDPVFWRSVDLATAGPLNVAALLPTAFLGIDQGYFNARLVGLLLVAGGLVLVFNAMDRLNAGQTARIAILPAVLFFALATDSDFVHYTSEHVAIFLIACSLALMLGLNGGPHGQLRPFLLRVAATGMIIGLLPWAKIQTGPIAAVLAGVVGWSIIRGNPNSPSHRWTGIGVLLAGAAAPTVVAAALIVSSGQTEHFYASYVAHNLFYAAKGQSLAHVLREYVRHIGETGNFAAFLAMPIIAIAAAATASCIRRKSPGATFWLCAVVAVAALAVVLAPRRAFLHYLLLAVIPITVWGGAAMHQTWTSARSGARRRAIVLGAAALGLVVPLVVRATQPGPFMVGRLTTHLERPYGEAAIAIREIATPEDSVAVWGWYPEVLVQTGLAHATREAQSQRQIEYSPLQDYYRRRYIDDFQKNRPKFFVDAVGPNSFAYENRSRFSHENFPELRDLVKKDYGLLVDLRHSRIYVRRDVLAAKASSQIHLK